MKTTKSSAAPRSREALSPGSLHGFKQWLPSLLAFAFSIGAPAASELHAQGGTGTLSGRVSEEESGQALHGATVTIDGTSYREYTDVSGRYTMPDLPAGDHTIEVRYIGREPTIADVTINAGSSLTLDVDLESSLVELDSVTVRAAFDGQSRAINQQKTASGIVNVVSEETFGSVLDGNIGQALQRLPGISVDEDQDGSAGSINIRGIAGEFNSVQIDGNRVPSSGGSRSFNPRQMAADGVTNIEVIKAPTPDRDGDAIGGIVNLVTRSAFQRPGRNMSVKAAGVLNEAPGNWGHSASFNYSDLFSIGGGERNLGVSFTLSSYDTDRYSINADQDWVQVTPANNPELNLDGNGSPVWFMESTHFEHDTRKTNTQTLSGSIDFRTDSQNSFYFRPMISHFERSGFQYETDIDIDTRFQDAAGGRKTYAELTSKYGRGTPGDDGSQASRGWIGTLDDQYNDLYSLSVGGRHERGDSLLTYDLYQSRNKNVVRDDSELNMLMEPDEPWFVFEYEVYHPDGLVRVDHVGGGDPTDLSQMTEGEWEDVSAVKTEEVSSARIDWEKTYGRDSGVFTFKSGLKYRKSSQNFDETVDLYEMDEAFPYASVLEPTDEVILLKPKYFNVRPEVGRQLLRSNPELFDFQVEDSLEDSNIGDYDATETTTAGYVMGTYEIGMHTIIAGVRFEENEWENVNKQVSFLSGEGVVSEVESGSSYSFWLPGIHLRHELSQNLILRESYNRSYGRPRLSELSRGRFVDDDGNIEDGNPNLKPALSDNLDLQLEYYTDRGGLYSAGVFYKDVQDFTYTQVYDFNELDANGIPIPAAGGEYEYERPVNGAGATNYGLELIARQQLFFLPGALQGLSVALSSTFTESDAEYPNRTDDRKLPLEGFSELIYTATLDYNWGDFSARVDYRFRDDYIEGLGGDIESDEFYAAEYRVDAEMSYRIGENVTLFATGSNLTDQPQVSYQGYAPFVEDASYAGRKFTFGAEYEF